MPTRICEDAATETLLLDASRLAYAARWFPHGFEVLAHRQGRDSTAQQDFTAREGHDFSRATDELTHWRLPAAEVCFVNCLVEVRKPDAKGNLSR